MSRRSLSGATVPFEVTVIVPSLDQAESMATRSDGAMRCRDMQGQIYRIVHGEIQVFASTGGAHLSLAFLHEEMRIAHSGIARTPQSGILRYQRDGSAEAWMKELLNFGNARVQGRDQRTPYVAESWSHRLLAGEVSGKGWTAGGKQGLRRVGVGHPRRAMHRCRWRPVRRLPMPSGALRSPGMGHRRGPGARSNRAHPVPPDRGHRAWVADRGGQPWPLASEQHAGAVDARQPT